MATGLAVCPDAVIAQTPMNVATMAADAMECLIFIFVPFSKTQMTFSGKYRLETTSPREVSEHRENYLLKATLSAAFCNLAFHCGEISSSIAAVT